MDSSNYIFEQGEGLFYVGIIVGLVFLSFTIYQFYKIRKRESNFYRRGEDDDKEIKRLPVAIACYSGGGIRFNVFFGRAK
jgi:hypothetical protein